MRRFSVPYSILTRSVRKKPSGFIVENTELGRKQYGDLRAADQREYGENVWKMGW
jgi:hypothetical protein